MKFFLFVLIMVSTFLSACNPEISSQNDFINQDNTTLTFADFPDLGVAPELENDVWLNVNNPLRLADLRGKVILLDMWTFG